MNYTSFSDDELVKFFYAGQNEAFDELLLRHKDRLYSYLLILAKNEDLADDLFQETFIKAVMYIRQGRYTGDGRFYAWLTRIAHNQTIDFFRSERPNNWVYKDGEEGQWNDVEQWYVQGSESDYEQQLNFAQSLMHQLPDEQRDMVMMRFYQDLSFKEIAEKLNISINTALGRMRYAVLNMRKMAQQQKML